MEAERRERTDVQFEGQRKADRRTGRHARYAQSAGQVSCRASTSPDSSMFGTGNITKRKSQEETELIRALIDPQAAANRAMRIFMENNCAAIRM